MTDEIQYFCSDDPLQKERSLTLDFYPNNEPIVPYDDRYRIDRVLVRANNLASFMSAMFWVDAYRERHDTTAIMPELIIPFPFGARQDRLNPEGNYLFTAKSIAAEINARQFKRVILLDPHSDVISGMIDRCVYLDPAGIITEDQAYHFPDGVIGDWTYPDVIICPDAGAGKRAMAVAQSLGKPLVHAWKHRNIENGAINGFGIAPLPDETLSALVVDDCCDGGGTFIGLAQQLPAVQLSLFVTHGIFSQGTAGLLEHYQNIYTTDSIIRNPIGAPFGLTQYDGITVLPISELLLWRGIV